MKFRYIIRLIAISAVLLMPLILVYAAEQLAHIPDTSPWHVVYIFYTLAYIFASIGILGALLAGEPHA
jgi:hypothetical protein